MAATTSHSRSSSMTSYSRPKLLRSCVTAPTLVPSYASRNDRSSSHFVASGLHSPSKDKATTLLNRVASYSYGYSEKSEQRRTQVTSAEKMIISGPPEGRGEIEEKGSSGKSKRAKISVHVSGDGGKHGGYFSFPSFEEFEEYSEKEESNSRESSTRRHTYR